MLGLLLLAFLVVPIVELYVFVQVADAFGFGTTLVWIVAVSVLGAWLVKREGLNALRRANDKAARGELPTDELISGIMILFAGALMLTPGFFTDAFGLVLLFPPTRALLRGSVRRRLTPPIVIGGTGSGSFGGFGGFGPTGSGTSPQGGVWDADSWEGPPDPPELR